MRKFMGLLPVFLTLVAAAGCSDNGGGGKIEPPVITPPATPDPLRDAFVPAADPYDETATKVVYLPQNWSAGESLSFYYTPQGSQLIPYDWFLALEQPGASTTPFRDNQNILKYRYLPQNKDAWNPDALPVGFVAETADNVKWLGMNCAACHTTELHVKNIAYRVDGAPTQANVQALTSDMIVAVKNTVDDPKKFDRFAAKVLAKNDAAGQAELKREMAKWVAIRSGYNRRNFPGFDPDATSPQGPLGVGRFGQLDAVGAIVNEVYWNAASVQDLNNPTSVSKPADAPVSYPFLWNAHQQNKVQWLGIAQSGGPGNILSLVRNVGEVVGVFGHIEIPDKIGFLNKGYRSTIDRPSLEKLEGLITTLWSPLWPEEAFGKIDRDSAKKGAEIFNRKLEQNFSCWDCHGEIKREDPNRSYTMTMFATGTDGRTFGNFGDRSGPSGKLKGLPANFIPGATPIPPNATATDMITNEVIGIILGTYTLNPPIDQLKDAEFGRRSAHAAMGAKPPMYEARPLNGIWATAPFLHNGSVPTLDALLRKKDDRPKTFTVGVRAFDTAKVGLAEPPSSASLPKLDTSVPGNSNFGHEFGTTLSEDERKWLIEYLKTL